MKHFVERNPTQSPCADGILGAGPCCDFFSFGIFKMLRFQHVGVGFFFFFFNLSEELAEGWKAQPNYF